LLINPGGDQTVSQIGECDIRTSGDVLVESLHNLVFTYRPGDDRIEARLATRVYEFVRA
jgi:hypothetical protein